MMLHTENHTRLMRNARLRPISIGDPAESRCADEHSDE